MVRSSPTRDAVARRAHCTKFIEPSAASPPAFAHVASTLSDAHAEESESFHKARTSTFDASAASFNRGAADSATIKNLLTSFKSDGGAKKLKEDATFREDVERTRKRIRELANSHLNPSSLFVRVWDVVTVCALIFTATATPFEIAFYDRIYNGPVNFFLNRLVDAIFVCDIFVCMFLPFRSKHGVVVFDRHKILMNYLQGWFALDAITCLPVDIIVALVAGASITDEDDLAGDGAGGGGGGGSVDAPLLRLLRMLRVLKLVRVVRASRIMARWQDRAGIPFALTSLIRFVILVCVLAHWLACLWGFVGFPAANAGVSESWVGYDAGQSWRQKNGVDDSANEFEVYGICLYVALGAVFGGWTFDPGNFVEFYVMAFMLLMGSSVWAYVIGSACGIISSLDRAGIEHRQCLDELNFFVRQQSIDSEFAAKMRNYFRNTLHSTRCKRYEQLLKKMSTRLHGDAAYRMSAYRLRAVPFLVHSDLEPEFMCHLATRYAMHVYSRLERIPCTSLFVVDRGVVAKRGVLGVVGTCFGKDVILSNDNLRDAGDAIALTFVQTISLSQKDIFELLPDFPRAYHIVRKAALRMALVRALIKAASIVKRAKHLSGAGPMGNIVEVFDRVMTEAADSTNALKNEAKEKKARYIPLTLKATGLASASFKTLVQSAKAKAAGGSGAVGGWGRLRGMAAVVAAEGAGASAASDQDAATSSASGGRVSPASGAKGAAAASGGAKRAWGVTRRASVTRVGGGARGLAAIRHRLTNLLDDDEQSKPQTVEGQIAALQKQLDANIKSDADTTRDAMRRLHVFEESLRAWLDGVNKQVDDLVKRRQRAVAVAAVAASAGAVRVASSQAQKQKSRPARSRTEGVKGEVARCYL